MNKQGLLEVLNADAKLLGVEEIGLRQLSDWIDEGLVGKARASGHKRGKNPDWHFPDDAIRRARAIVRSISFGTVRKTEHRLFLWISGFEFPTKDIRKSFKNEFRRFVRRQRRSADLRYDHRDQGRPGKLEEPPGQIQDLHPLLEALKFDLPSVAVRQFSSESYFGNSPRDGGLLTLAKYLSEKFKIPLQPLLDQLSVFSMEGLLGDPEEIDDSGIQLLENANDADFEIGRLSTKAFIGKIEELSTIENPDYRNFAVAAKLVRRVICGPNWLISFLASGILAALKSRKEKTLRFLTGIPKSN